MNMFSWVRGRGPSSTIGVGGSRPAGQYNLSKGGSVYVVNDGNQYIWNFRANAPYRLHPFDPSSPKLSPAVIKATPSRLLAAQYEIVDLVGRESELAELTAWAAGQSPVAVRLVHGMGGQGKTRLAAQFARNLYQSGWAVADAFHSTALSVGAGDIPAVEKGTGLLVLIDYADRWPAADLISLFRAHLHLPGPVRVLLIARGVSGWWPSIETSLLDAGIGNVDNVALSPLAAGLVREGSDTSYAFFEAVKAFAPYFDLEVPERVPIPKDIWALANEHALTLYMAALAATDATARGTSIPSGRLSAKYLLERERNGWNQLQQANTISITARQLGHASFVAALTSPLPYDEGRKAIEVAGVASSTTEADQVLADHTRVYPCSAVDTVLESMAPDRLAEDYLAFTLLTPDEYGFGDVWAAPALAKLIRSKGQIDETVSEVLPIYARHLVTTLVEAASRWPRVLTDVLWPLMTDNPALVQVGGGATVARLATLVRTDAEMLRFIDEQLPKNVDVEFDQAAAVVAEHLVDLSHAAVNEHPEQYSELLLRTGWRFYNAGKYDKAGSAISNAVDILRVLADPKAGDFAVHGANLAAALTSLGANLVRQQDVPGAVAATREAVAIEELLAAHDPDSGKSYLPDLSMALNNLGALLLEQGEPLAAVDVSQKAIHIRRILADPKTGDFAVYGAGLAGSLSNLGTQLAKIPQQLVPALTVTQEAVSIYRMLINAKVKDSAAILPELAGALSNLSSRLLDVQKGKEALVEIEESVRLYRILSNQESGNPDVYLPDLANSLVNLGAVLSGLEYNCKALPPTAEAMEIYQMLADHYSSESHAYRPQLARTWNNLGHICSQLGRRSEAMDASQSAVELYSALADPVTGNPAAYGALLEMAKNNVKIISMNLE